MYKNLCFEKIIKNIMKTIRLSNPQIIEYKGDPSVSCIDVRNRKDQFIHRTYDYVYIHVNDWKDSNINVCGGTTSPIMEIIRDRNDRYKIICKIVSIETAHILTELKDSIYELELDIKYFDTRYKDFNSLYKEMKIHRYQPYVSHYNINTLENDFNYALDDIIHLKRAVIKNNTPVDVI